MASKKIEDAHEVLQKQFTQAKAAFEKEHPTIKVILTTSYRSTEKQTSLYNQPFDKKDDDGDKKIDEADEKVTQAKAGQSPHNYLPSYAIDVAFLVDGKLDWNTKWLKPFSTKMIHPQIEWGGIWKFTDHPHFEIKGWKEAVKKK